MIFISAGHNPFGIKTDSGAVGNGFREADVAIEFRNLVAKELQAMNVAFKTDKDDETLGQYLSRINTGSGSVVVEFHLDASDKLTATGCTAIIGADADRFDKAFATELVNATSGSLILKNRGVISETDSHRGRLGLMRESGTVALLELCFISNKEDMRLYNLGKQKLAKQVADILIRYEKLL